MVAMRGHTCIGPIEKLQRVRKPGGNLGRLFWSCSRKGCGAEFMWADGGFPACGCGGKSRIRMAKKGVNCGKWFFACGKKKGDGEVRGRCMGEEQATSEVE